MNQKVRKADSKERKALKKLIRDFSERLAHVSILDPACGSGNFLYVSLHLLLDLEKEVITYAARQGIGQFPQIRPTQLAGIEINPYAQELASVVIWIGYLQWMHHNGFNPPSNPVLEPIESIRRMDAILDLSDPAHPSEPEWPAAEFIVGNPPILTGGKLRSKLPDKFEAIFSLYRDRIPNASDLCCYWFEKSRRQIENGLCKRAGLIATQGIRGKQNRTVLERIKNSGDLFFAISDRDWMLDGASLHVSLIGFDDASETIRTRDGVRCTSIHTDLTCGVDVTTAASLHPSAEIYQEGIKKGADFDIDVDIMLDMLNDQNPTGRPNSDVLRFYINGNSLTSQKPARGIICFPPSCGLEDASRYASPFEHIKKVVYPKYGDTRREWWIHERARPTILKKIHEIPRYAVTVRHSKHRIFVWLDSSVLPDSALGAFLAADDFQFGILQSHPHSIWSLSQGTQVRERESGFRYTATTCLETFPFPEPTDAQRKEIAEAAQELDQLRCNWLNPPEWTKTEYLEFPGTMGGPWDRYIARAVSKSPGADASGSFSREIGTVRYPRVVLKDDASAAKLKKRTLTNLYNERPTWLDLAHKKLDAAVFAAYGWDAGMSDDALLAALLKLNLERAGK